MPFLFNRPPSKLLPRPDPIDLQPHTIYPLCSVSNSAGEITHLLVSDENGLIVEMPLSIFKANGIDYVDLNNIIISNNIYQAWFKEKKKQTLQELYKIVELNFLHLVSNSQTVLDDAEFRSIKLPLLNSTMLFLQRVDYTIGSLLNSWLKSDDLLYEAVYIIRISGSPTSGNNYFTAFCPLSKKIIKGSMKKRKWIQYYKVFEKLNMNSEKSEESDILILERLISQFDLK